MELFWNIVEYVLERGGYEQIFYSASLFGLWWRRNQACLQHVEDGAGKTGVFEVEQTPFFYSCELGTYLPDLPLKHLWQCSNLGETNVLILEYGTAVQFYVGTRFAMTRPAT